MRDDSVYDSSYAAKSDANEKKRYCGLASSLRRTDYLFFIWRNLFFRLQNKIMQMHSSSFFFLSIFKDGKPEH